MLVSGIAMLGTLAWAAGAQAQSPEPDPVQPAPEQPGGEQQPTAASADEAPRGPSAGNRAARSALFPAWGQLTNGRTAKAAALFALETYLASSIIVESRKGAAKERLADEAPDEATEEMYDGLADAHYDRRRNLIFWSLLTVLYGVADAYVDANLGDFDREIKEGGELFGRVDGVDRTIELGVRF
jgi:hypothetical protein